MDVELGEGDGGGLETPVIWTARRLSPNSDNARISMGLGLKLAPRCPKKVILRRNDMK